MEKKDELIPVYELKINPDEGMDVSVISLVKNPAVESNFLAFSKDSNHLKFNSDDEKMEILGLAMNPDVNIPRKEGDFKYYVKFSKDTIREIVQNYFQKNYINNSTLEHTDIDAKSYVFQSYIVDEAKGVTAPTGIIANDGAWIVGMKVTDKKVWDLIKAEGVQGFSVEGFFNQFLDDFKVSNFSKNDALELALKELEAELDAFISLHNIK
nr:XkdF-like putative serine protease domain-containing protein [uncultured Sphingobacterium sp.]